MKLLDYVIGKTNEYIENMPKSLRKRYGQFFTSKETASFMAGLFALPSDRRSLKMLDAGAGSGVLSVALIEELQSHNQFDHIELVCYENDSNIIDLLEKNLKWVSKHSVLDVDYEIRTENYNILETPVTDYGAIQDTIYAKVEMKFKKQSFLYKKRKLLFDFQIITYCSATMQEMEDYPLAINNSQLMAFINNNKLEEELSEDLYKKIRRIVK